MTDQILQTHRLLTATMTVVALLGWGTYAYSAHSSATRDQERLETIARVTSDRDGLQSEQRRMLSEHQQLASEQQRLSTELALTKAQLAASREELALLEPQQKVARTGDAGAGEPDPPRKAAQKQPSKAKARSKMEKLAQR